MLVFDFESLRWFGQVLWDFLTYEREGVMCAGFGAGAAIAAGITAAASIAGSAVASSQQKRASQRLQESMDAERKRNRQHFDKLYYDEGTQRADVQRALTESASRLHRNNQAAAGKAAVMGGTNAEAAATKEANNQAYASAVGTASAAAAERKDNLADQMMKTDNAYSAQQRQANYDTEVAKIGAIQSAVQGVGTAAAGMATAAGNASAANAESGGQQPGAAVTEQEVRTAPAPAATRSAEAELASDNAKSAAWNAASIWNRKTPYVTNR